MASYHGTCYPVRARILYISYIDMQNTSQFWHNMLQHVEVYKLIVLALFISSDFWLRWLVHEA
jgi:hypothetical protein